jgi:hemolysin III
MYQGGIMSRLDSIKLVDYSRKEDWVNSITHIIGAVFAIIVLVLCIGRGVSLGRTDYVLLSIVYGVTMLAVFVCSSVYHGLRPNKAKKVMRVIDHAMINFMIVGTITPYMVLAVAPLNPIMGWTLLIACWVAAITAVVITFTLFNKTKVIQMVLYMVIGWSSFMTVFVLWKHFSKDAIFLMVSGGIAYTIGAILYGIGRKKKYIHAVFHIFIIIGAFLHFLGLYMYVFV